MIFVEQITSCIIQSVQHYQHRLVSLVADKNVSLSTIYIKVPQGAVIYTNLRWLVTVIVFISLGLSKQKDLPGCHRTIGLCYGVAFLGPDKVLVPYFFKKLFHCGVWFINVICRSQVIHVELQKSSEYKLIEYMLNCRSQVIQV